jgi:hypothetical protein
MEIDFETLKIPKKFSKNGIKGAECGQQVTQT